MMALKRSVRLLCYCFSRFFPLYRLFYHAKNYLVVTFNFYLVFSFDTHYTNLLVHVICRITIYRGDQMALGTL